MLQTEDEVVNDTVAVLHDGGAHLYVAASELDEVQRIAPGLNTADTADIHMFLNAGIVQNGMACHLVYHTQCNRLDRLAGIAAYGLLAAHGSPVAHSDGFDRIDRADTGCSTVETSQCRRGHGHDVRRHFRDNRYLNGLANERGVE